MAKAAIRITAKPILPTKLVTVVVSPTSMSRVSSYATGEPYFGKHQGNRFDDPEPDPSILVSDNYLGR